ARGSPSRSATSTAACSWRSTAAWRRSWPFPCRRTGRAPATCCGLRSSGPGRPSWRGCTASGCSTTSTTSRRTGPTRASASTGSSRASCSSSATTPSTAPTRGGAGRSRLPTSWAGRWPSSAPGRGRAGCPDERHAAMTRDGDGRDPDSWRVADVMPGLVVAYALLAAGGYLWLRWRDRTEMLAEHAVGRHGALAAVAVGTATAFAFYGLGRLAARYVPAFAALEATLAGLLGTLRERQAVVVALTSGAAEEFFFRGAMQDALGWTITTVAFALSNYGGPRLRLWCV